MQAHHAEEALDDAPAALGRGAHLLGARLGLRIGGEFVQQRRLGDDHGERIVELVRDAGEQRAHRRHLLVLVQLLALAVDLVLGLPPLAQVADRAEEDAPVGDLHLVGRELDRKDLAGGVLGDRLHAAAEHRRAAPGHVVAAIGEALAVEARDDRVEQVLADDVGLGEAVHLLRGGIEFDDLAALVDHDDRVERGLQECGPDHLADMRVGLAALDAVGKRQRDDLHRRLVVVASRRVHAAQSLIATEPQALPLAKIGMDRNDLIFWFSKSCAGSLRCRA